MYAYCGNEPVNRVDPTGLIFEEIFGAIEDFFSSIGEGIAAMAPAYAGCATAAAADGPLPIGDVIGATVAIAITAGVAGYEIGERICTLFDSKVETKEKEKEKDITMGPPQLPTFIYRYGGTNPGNLTPSQRDIALYAATGKGLSFSTVPKPGAAMTTIAALNATGVVYAVYDGANHVSVFPIGGSLEDWYNAGPSSAWTAAVKAVVVKWDGTNLYE